MTTAENIDEGAAAPTEFLVQLTEAGTATARWVLGTDDVLSLGVAEDALDAPSAEAGTAPGGNVAAWVAESLGVTAVELTETGNGRWSVGITD